ncbi:unnamed protein product, partial [Eretmochelys imbricata]
MLLLTMVSSHRVSAVSTRSHLLSAARSSTRSVALMAKHTATNASFAKQSGKTLEVFALRKKENA